MNVRDKHKKDLGLDVPMGYFSNSKNEILKATLKNDDKVVFLSRRIYYWSAAVVIALIVSVNVFNSFKVNEIERNIYNDIIITSISVNEDEIDAFVNDFVDNNLLTENIFSE